MQLVVMAAVLAVVGAGQDCRSRCHLTTAPIAVETCTGSTELIYTTMCLGQCDHEDPVYIGPADRPKQKVCNGDWSYEVKHINGCPEGVTYPVARSCDCTTCDSNNTDCGRYFGDVSTCVAF